MVVLIEYKGKKTKAISIINQAQVFSKYSILKMRIETGRFHQIRLQLQQEFNYSILGDDLHGDFALNKLLLDWSSK